MMGSIRFLWVAVACLGMAALLLACAPAQPASTAIPGTESPEPVAATPAAPVDSPLPTPAQEMGATPKATRLIEINPSVMPGAKPLPEFVPGLTPHPPVTGEVPGELLEAILADLAGRLSAGADEIEVVRGESVTWSDGSLGCPEPGMMYTQALVDGYWVVLEHGGQAYDYRATEGGYFRPCENPGTGVPGMPVGGETE